MAVAIPVIAAFASAGAAVATAGGVAAALGTVTGFLAIGGAALTAVGAITKNSKLTKVGAILGLAGGVGSALGVGAAGSASGAAAQEAANAAWSAGGAAEVAGGAGASSLQTATQAAGAAAPEAAAAAGEAASQSANKLALANAGAEVGGSGIQFEPKLFQTALNMKDTATADPSIYSLGSSPLQTKATAAGLTSNDVLAGLKAGASKVGSAISPVGQWVKDNKELVGIGASMAAAGLSAGAESERLDMMKQRDAFDRSIYHRRMANLNSPIALYNKGA